MRRYWRSANPRKKAKGRAWAYQSKYIRYVRDINPKSGLCVCFTCDKERDPKLMQAGHFKHADALDFVLDALHSQCLQCNGDLGGNLVEYRKRMVKKYGKRRVEQLEQMAHQVVKVGEDFFCALADKYKEILKCHGIK